MNAVVAYEPAPALLSPREEKLLMQLRAHLAENDTASIVQVTALQLRTALDYIERLERDRDAEGDGAVSAGRRARHAEAQLVTVIARVAATVKWAASELGCDARLESVTRAIDDRTATSLAIAAVSA